MDTRSHKCDDSIGWGIEWCMSQRNQRDDGSLVAWPVVKNDRKKEKPSATTPPTPNAPDRRKGKMGYSGPERRRNAQQLSVPPYTQKRRAS